MMINLIETPQRGDFKINYEIDGDRLVVVMGEIREAIDLTDPGIIFEDTLGRLPINPIVSIHDNDNIIEVTVIRYYGEDEKHLFETS